MTDIVRTDARPVITPLTGEVVLLDSPTDTLADWLHRIRQAEADIRDAKRTVTLELLDRMDREARWTARIGGFEIKGDGPGAVDYDAERLRTELHLLVQAGEITETAMDEAVEIVQTYKAKARGINALRKLGGRVAAAIDACAHPSTRDRRVTVKETARR
jgi:hypothetical protein